MKTKKNKISILSLATEARKTYFQFFSMNACEMKRCLPDWLLYTIQLIPRNSLVWDFEREQKHQCYWEDFLQTLLLRGAEKKISFKTGIRLQNTPFGKHFGVGLGDRMPWKKKYTYTFEQFHQMVGRKILFSKEEGYLVISFIG